MTTDETGQERERIEYGPFGQVVAQTVSGGTAEEAYFQYTGHRFDEESDLLFMEARYYDPRLARFLTPDSVVPDVTNPQALNRYAYAYNNPIRLMDPSGHSPQDAVDENKEPEPANRADESNSPSRPPLLLPSGPKDNIIGPGIEDALDKMFDPLAPPRFNPSDPGNRDKRSTLKWFWNWFKHIWALPNTVVGAVWGVVSIPTGGVDFGEGQLRFQGSLVGSGLMYVLSFGEHTGGAITLGDVAVFNRGSKVRIPGTNLSTFIARHEALHTPQTHVLGPLYIPANILGGVMSIITPMQKGQWSKWDGRANFMEYGPSGGEVWGFNYRGKGVGRWGK